MATEQITDAVDDEPVVENEYAYDDPTLEDHGTPGSLIGDAPKESEGVEESAPSAGVEESAASAREPVEFDDQLLQIASDYGVTPEVAKTFESADALAEFIASRPAQQQSQQNRQPQQQQPAQQGQQRQGYSPYAIDLEAFRAAGYEDSDPVVTQIQAMNQHYSQYTNWLVSQLQQSQQMLGQVHSSVQAQQMQALTAQLDSLFDELGDDLYGSSENLTPSARLRRQQAYREMDAMSVVYQQRGMQIPSLRVLRDRILGINSNQQKTQQGNTSRDKNGRFVARGSKANSKSAKSGTQRAIEYVNERLTDAGIA